MQAWDPVLPPTEMLGLERFLLYPQSIDTAEQAFTSTYPHHPLLVQRSIGSIPLGGGNGIQLPLPRSAGHFSLLQPL